MTDAMNEKGFNDPVRFMSRHFVALVCHYETPNSNSSAFQRRTSVYSGFVLELLGDWYWVTAGHCLKDLDTAIRSTQLRVTGGGFMDYFGYQATHEFMLPFRYEVGCSFYLENREEGVDFALIKLDWLQRRGLESNKNMPIGRENWIHQPRLSFDFYRMLGIPECGISTNGAAEDSLLVRPAMIAVNRRDPSEVEGASSDQWFVGQLDSGATIETIKGMSGGPIYGFRRDDNGDLRYHAVALQSSWFPDSRVIFGCSLPLFAEELHLVLVSMIEQNA